MIDDEALLAGRADCVGIAEAAKSRVTDAQHWMGHADIWTKMLCVQSQAQQDNAARVRGGSRACRTRCRRSWNTIRSSRSRRRPSPAASSALQNPVPHDVIEQVHADQIAEHEVIRAREVLAPAEPVEQDRCLVGQGDASFVAR